MSETWWIADGVRAAVEARAALDVAAWMQGGEDRTVLSTDRQSAAVRWAGAPPLLVKWRAVRPGRRRRTLLRPSRERSEARALLRAAAWGAPTPWALGERRRRGLLVGSVLVRPFDDGARSVEQAAREEPGVLLRLAAALRALHDAGFRHGDCYPKNFLVGGVEERVRPIGCPKARFARPGPALDRARLKDLGQLAAGCVALQPWGDPLAFLAAYGEAPGLPAYEELAAAVLPFYERVMERKAERTRTRPRREPGGPPAPRPLSPGPRPRVRVRRL